MVHRALRARLARARPPGKLLAPTDRAEPELTPLQAANPQGYLANCAPDATTGACTAWRKTECSANAGAFVEPGSLVALPGCTVAASLSNSGAGPSPAPAPFSGKFRRRAAKPTYPRTNAR